MIPTWKTELKQLQPGVYAYIQEKGSWGLNDTGVLVSDEGVLLVDTLFTIGLTQRLLADVAVVRGQPVAWLYYTHQHGDHVFGSGLLPDAMVVGKVCWTATNT